MFVKVSLLFTLHYIIKKTIFQFTSQASKLNYNCSLTNTSFTFISIPLPCILRILNIHADCTLQFKCCTWFWYLMIFLYLSWNGKNEKSWIGMCYKHECSLFSFSLSRVSSSYCCYLTERIKIFGIFNSHFIAMKITLNET